MESAGSQARTRSQEAALPTSTRISSLEYSSFLVQLRPAGLAEQAGQVWRQGTAKELQEESDEEAEEGDGVDGNGTEPQLSAGGDEDNGVTATEPASTSWTHGVTYEEDRW